MAIQKATIQLVVLFDDEETKPSFFEGGSLADIAGEVSDGPCLGRSTLLSIQEVPAEKLTEEQCALGNDGSFFLSATEWPAHP